MQLADLIRKQFGVETYVRVNRLVTELETTVLLVVPNDPNRVSLFLVNLSTYTMYFAWDNAPSSARGVRVAPNGGTLRLVWDEDFDITGWEIWGIAAGASADIFTVEILIGAESLPPGEE